MGLRARHGARRDREPVHLAGTAGADHAGRRASVQSGLGFPADTDPAHHALRLGRLPRLLPLGDVREHRPHLSGRVYGVGVSHAHPVSPDVTAGMIQAHHGPQSHDASGGGLSHADLPGHHSVGERAHHLDRRSGGHAAHRVAHLRTLQRPRCLLRLHSHPGASRNRAADVSVRYLVPH